MRGRNNRPNSELRSVIFVKPKEYLDTVINKIVVAIVAVELQEELRVVRELETFHYRLLLNLYYPSADRFRDVGIVEIGLCNDAYTSFRIPMEINLALWMD